MIETTTSAKIVDTPVKQAKQEQQAGEGWSQQEQQVAEAAFQKAYQREIEALIRRVREQSGSLATTDQVWQLHDFLSSKRFELDGKYDYRYPRLLFVFASLIKEGWLHRQELEGLAPDKLAKISALTRMC